MPIDTTEPVTLSFDGDNRFVLPHGRTHFKHVVVFANPDATAIKWAMSEDAETFTLIDSTEDTNTADEMVREMVAPRGGAMALHAVDPTNVTGFYFALDTRSRELMGGGA